MNNIKEKKDEKSETGSQVLMSMNKLRSKTNFIATSDKDFYMTPMKTPTQV